MKTNKIVVCIAIILFIASSCGKTSSSKVIYEKKFAEGHSDWKISGDTIIKNFDLQFNDGRVPLKVLWLVSKDKSGCMQVSYTRLEQVNMDSDLKSDRIKAEPGMCGSDWESADSVQYNQMVITGNFTKSFLVKTNVKEGNFLTITGNGKAVVH